MRTRYPGNPGRPASSELPYSPTRGPEGNAVPADVGGLPVRGFLYWTVCLGGVQCVSVPRPLRSQRQPRGRRAVWALSVLRDSLLKLGLSRNLEPTEMVGGSSLNEIFISLFDCFSKTNKKKNEAL